MKKVFSACMITVMLLSFGFSAAAEELSQVEVTYTADEHYEISIPASQNMGDGMEVMGTVAANSVCLAEGTALHVNMQSQNGFSLVCGNSSIGYTVSANGSAVSNGSDVLVVEAGSTEGSTALVFATDAANVAGATLAGEHTDTISFTANVLAGIADESVPTTSTPEGNRELPALVAVILAGTAALAADKVITKKRNKTLPLPAENRL